MIFEIYKDIKGFEGRYMISNIGNVKSLIRNKILKPFGKNYLMIVLRDDQGKKNYKYIHRLVAEAFIGNIKNLPCVNHKDGNKKNNVVSNLEFCTYSYNIKESFRIGLSYNGKGKENGRSKSVKQYDKKGNFIKEYESARIAENELKISHIIECCKNKRKTAGGYIWKYATEDKNAC